MNNKTLIIHNPKSGPKSSKEIIRRLISQLEETNTTIQIMQTKYAGHATEFCKNINLSEFNKLIICGGDGTFNEVINGIMFHKKTSFPIIGFLPGGTGNAFMHDLKATNPNTAIQNIIRGNTKKIDIMKLDFTTHTEYAINIVGWGMAGDINILSEKLRIFGSSRYTIASIYYTMNKISRKAKVIIDEREFVDNFLFILNLNTIHTGKGMKAAPKAKLDDGLLDVIILKSNISRLELLLLLPKIYTGKHILSKKVEYLQAKKIQIFPETQEILNIDGEMKCSTPVNISVMSKAINIFSRD